MSVTADEDLAFSGPAALAELVRSRQVQPRELVELCLRRIEALNPRLNAFRTTMAEQALAEADAAESSDGPLAGVPIGLKDDIRSRGNSPPGVPGRMAPRLAPTRRQSGGCAPPARSQSGSRTFRS